MHCFVYCKLFTLGSEWKHFNPVQDERWEKYFKLKKLKTRTKKFDNLIRTDGVSISFTFARVKDKNVTQKQDPLQPMKDKAKNDDYDRYIELDPGLKVMLGGVIREKDHLQRQDKNFQHVKLSGNKFRHETQHLRRKYQLNKWTKTVEEKSRSTLSSFQADYHMFVID